MRTANKNGWFTAEQARNYYGRYSRDNYIVHWWGEPGQVGDHDATVNYILEQAAAGNMSANYVVSDQKITMVVPPDAVSWGAQSGNPTGVNVEHSPSLGAEGYKKAGWLKDQLEQRWGKRLALKRHSDYNATRCPGTIDLDGIEREAEKWRSGAYDAQPAPTPAPAPAEPVVVALDKVVKYTLANAKLVNIKDLTLVKTFALDTPMDIGGTVSWNGQQFLLTVSARDQKRLQGFLIGDLKDAPTPAPVPPTPPPSVPPPAPAVEQLVTDLSTRVNKIDGFLAETFRDYKA
jgi:hypothetical protein